jgi:hypothetical protein
LGRVGTDCAGDARKKSGAELHFLTVAPPLPGQVYGHLFKDFELKMIAEGKATIGAFSKDHAQGTNTKAHIAQGQPYGAILDLVKNSVRASS